MFDLEQNIAEWRKQMFAAGIQTPVPLEELEIHLREDIEQQMRCKTSEQMAFESAAYKIGQSYLLKTEFAKVAAEKKSAKWERRLAGLVLVGAVIPLVTFGFLRKDYRLLGFADFAVVILAVLGCRFIIRALPAIPHRRMRTSIGIVLGLLGVTTMVIFVNCILPNPEFTGGLLTVAVLWTLTLLAALGAVWAGLEKAARNQAPPAS